MSAERLEKLIESYLNDTLSESEWAELNSELEKSGESRDRLREMVGTHQDLSELYSIRAPILPLELDSPVASVSAVPQRKGIFWMAVLYGNYLVVLKRSILGNFNHSILINDVRMVDF